jgi:Xaa-Pro aminopeptidase
VKKEVEEKNIIENRIEALRKEIKEHKLTGFLITCQENRRYFSGFKATDPMLTESSGSLFITDKKLYLLTDSRYVLAAAEEAPLFEVIDCQVSLGGAVAKLAGNNPIIGFEAENLTVAREHEFKRSFKRVELVPSPMNVSSLRISKSPQEIADITKALRITEKAIGLLWDELKVGSTESWAAWFLDRHFRDLGGEGPAFETIVAAGPRAALPHASPGSKKITASEMVVIDCGARYNGYASDITRTMTPGKILPWQKEIYRIVREAQLKALEIIGPGVPANVVDKVARNHIFEAGYGDYFGHSLGHGVGLAVHEAPSLNPINKKPLEVGSVVTIEPGIYLPNRGGVRLEQLVLITENGKKVLNSDKHFYDF